MFLWPWHAPTDGAHGLLPRSIVLRSQSPSPRACTVLTWRSLGTSSLCCGVPVPRWLRHNQLKMGLSSSQHTSESDIHCQLHTSVTRKILCEQFNSSGVLRRHIHVLLQERIHPDTCSCFSEDARHGALGGDSAFLDAATAQTARCWPRASKGSVTPFTPILSDLELQTQPGTSDLQI